MRIGLQCYDCIIKQFVKLIDKQIMNDLDKEKLLKELIHMLITNDTGEAAPIVVKDIYNKLHKAIGTNDPYKKIKKQSNDFALKMVDSLKNAICKSDDKFLTGLRLSIAGNILDCGAPGGKNIEELDDFYIDSLKYEFDSETLNRFKDDLNNAKNILFIGDNAGEIVFDKIFIQQLPIEKITYCVRGNPIINDITMEDAQYVGMDKIVKVITTGDNTPGIDFKNSSQEFIETFNNSDLVILKGQGNFETLGDRDLSGIITNKIPIYFLFKIKCEYLSKQINREFGSVQLIQKN